MCRVFPRKQHIRLRRSLNIAACAQRACLGWLSVVVSGCQCLNGVSHPSPGQALNHFRPFLHYFTPLKQRRGMTRTNKVLYSEDRTLRELSARLRPPSQRVPACRKSFSKTRQPTLNIAIMVDARGGAAARFDTIMQWQSRRLDTAHLVQPAFADANYPIRCPW